MGTTDKGPKDDLLSSVSLGRLRAGIFNLRGNQTIQPEAAIIVPVNAQNDIGNYFTLLDDLVMYQGNHCYEVIAVVNNYSEENPPPVIECLKEIGVRVVSIPDARVPGEEVSFSARLPGVRVASSENTIHFDADCRIPNSTGLLDYYLSALNEGCVLAYTPVDFFDLPDGLATQIRIAIHHGVRSLKRNVLKIPTPRGSNYGINREFFLQLYDTGKMITDTQLGPNIKALGRKHQYCHKKELAVLTSGRKVKNSWLRVFTYIYRRLKYNLRYLPDIEAAKIIKQKS